MKLKSIKSQFLTRCAVLLMVWITSLGVISSAESNAVVFERKSGEVTLFKFENSPRITMSGSVVTVADKLNTLEMEMADVARFYMADAAGVDNVTTDAVTISLESSSIVLAGLADGAPVQVFTIDGMLRATLTAVEGQPVSIDRSKFPTGILIIATPGNTFKIVNK